ncbi:MAG: PatB family C-S lyase [Clostridia bacterium]|nr:PatB family C-S lyase [Clostridia bacterium]
MNEFYREYLDAEVDRRGTNCEKWDKCQEHFGRADVIPMWVADMDFRTVPAISEALVKRAQHAIYGYTENAAEEKAAEAGWLKRRYGLEIDPEWILYSPGVVDSIFFCVRSMTEKGDKILVQPPVYGPFYRAVQLFGRELVENRLARTERGWEMDFELLEKQFAGGVKMMILCSPHNPVGRVWTRAELTRLVELANRYDVIIVSDEIHADFILDGTPHTRILSIKGADKCVMLTSATKSFNLAGLRQSSAIVKNAGLRKLLQDEIERAHAGTPNIFGAIAQTVAYNEGDEWMDAVVEYIRENRDYAVDFIRARIPEIECYPQEGSYLMWLDCREVGLSHEEFFRKVIDEAGVAINDGRFFGEETGRGFFRFNLATQRRNVQAALENIEKMVRSINQ